MTLDRGCFGGLTHFRLVGCKAWCIMLERASEATSQSSVGWASFWVVVVVVAVELLECSASYGSYKVGKRDSESFCTELCHIHGKQLLIPVAINTACLSASQPQYPFNPGSPQISYGMLNRNSVPTCGGSQVWSYSHLWRCVTKGMGVASLPVSRKLG